jgi:hypothetical protein
VDSSSYMLPVDGGDITSLAYAELQGRFPQFPNIVFNPLLASADMAVFDFTATVDNSGSDVLPAPTPYVGIFPTRAQSGREASPAGLTPLSTAILPANNQTTPPKPGVLVTDTIDISAATGGEGASNFLVYWKVYQIVVSDEIMSDWGLLSGTNQAAIKSLVEIDPETSGFVVAISTDDGSTYQPVEHLEPISFCLPGTNIRLAFLNTTSDKIYLATYAVMF